MFLQTYLLSLQTMKDVFSLMITKKQLLITPISIGFGLGSGFMYSEMTRAFSSCVLGVSQVRFNRKSNFNTLIFIHL